MEHKWFVYKTFDEASVEAANFVAEKIQQAITTRGICNVILPGGNTPKQCLAYLSEKILPWGKIHWYLGDERCYPASHEDRNDVMLDNYFWSRLPVANIHRIRSELGPEEAAKLYRQEISQIEKFDLAFLGLGEDGHTASLFPDNEALQDERSVVPVFNSPKLPDLRISLSRKTLKNASSRIVLAGGISKNEILGRIRAGDALPVNTIGSINWFVDEPAAQ